MPLQPGDLVFPQVFGADDTVFFHTDMHAFVGAQRTIEQRRNGNYFALIGDPSEFMWPESALIHVHPRGAFTDTLQPGDMVIPTSFAEEDRYSAVGWFTNCMPQLVGLPGEVVGIHTHDSIPCAAVYTPDKTNTWVWPLDHLHVVCKEGESTPPAYNVNDLVELADGTWVRVDSISGGGGEPVYRLWLLDYSEVHTLEADISTRLWEHVANCTTMTITAPVPGNRGKWPVGTEVRVITAPTEYDRRWQVGVHHLTDTTADDRYVPIECLSGFTRCQPDAEPETLFDAYTALQVKFDADKAARRAELRARAKRSLEVKMKTWLPASIRNCRAVRCGILTIGERKSLKYQGEYRAMFISAVRRYPEHMDVLGEAILALPGLATVHEHIALIEDKAGKFYGKRPAFIRNDTFLSRPELIAQVVHISEEDPLKVAYYPSIAYMKAGRCISTTVGRYLTKFCSVEAFNKVGLPGGMTELEIKRHAEAYRIQYGPTEVKWAYTRDECIRTVAEGPTESCMANGYCNNGGDRGNYGWFEGHIHPAAVYGTSDTHPDVDTAVAYLEDTGGVITARVICNKRTKKCARGYGDYGRLIKALAEAGWRQESGALVGARLALIEDENRDGNVILPYVDAGTASGGGNLYVQSDGDYLIAGDDGISTYLGYDKAGSVSLDADDEDDRRVCDVCGQRHDEDDSHWSDYHDTTICSNCIDAYEYAYTGRYDQDWILREELYEYDGVHYTLDALSDHNLGMDDDGDVYPIDEVVSTPTGTWHIDSCTKLDVPAEDGDYDYVLDDDVVDTYDGRDIYAGEATTHHWHDGNDYILHEDDDPEDYLPAKEEETIELAA